MHLFIKPTQAWVSGQVGAGASLGSVLSTKRRLHQFKGHYSTYPRRVRISMYEYVKLIHTRGYSIKSLLLRRRFGLQTGSLFSVYDTQGPTRLQRALNSLRSVASQIHVAFGRWKMSIKHFRCADRSWQKEGTPSRQEFTPHLLGPATHPS